MDRRLQPADAVDRYARGFSLLEVLFATTLLMVAVSALAQLVVVASRANSDARTTTLAAVVAQQKMEQLRGLTYGFDLAGQPLTDTTTDVSVIPERPYDGTGLAASPPGALTANSIGYVDYLDGAGRSLGAGSAIALPGSVFVRRWSIEPLPSNPECAIVLQVAVLRLPGRQEARLITVKSRKAT